MVAVSTPSSRPTSSNTGTSGGHTVKSGESLSSIARQHNVELQDLIRANPQIKNPDLIFPGQQVTVPETGSAKATAPAGSAAAAAPQAASERTAASPEAVRSSRARSAQADATARSQLGLSDGYQAAPSLDAVRAGEARLRRGMAGDSVAQLQTQLNQAGAGLTVDGKFGAATESAVSNYQASRGVPDSGVVGPSTLTALDENRPAVAQPATGGGTSGAQSVAPAQSTAGMSEAQKYDHYANLIQQNGGQLKTGVNERNVVGLRNTTDADTNGGLGRYDDRMAMVWKDASGNKRVREYTGNTEPSARYRGRMGVDANGDGRLDQGRIPPGYYEYTTGRSSKLGNVLYPTKDFRVDRDTNQDGLFNDGRTSYGGNSMLIHVGGNSMTGSAGCVTMSPAEYSRFWRDLNSNGNPGRVGFTLIQAN